MLVPEKGHDSARIVEFVPMFADKGVNQIVVAARTLY